MARVNLPGLGGRAISQLSGGQQQRIAVARALVYEPAVLLMDEPLGALDRKLRKHLQVELRQLQQDLKISCIYVTHDQEEALTMSDRIAVMQNGRIHQLGDPVAIYRHPVSSFVADFVGSTNLFACRVRSMSAGGDMVLVTALGTEMRVDGLPGAAPGTACDVAVRPEYVRLGGDPAGQVSLPGVVAKIVFVGNVVALTCTLETGEIVNAEIPGSSADRFAVGDRVMVGWDRADMGVFARS